MILAHLLIIKENTDNAANSSYALVEKEEEQKISWKLYSPVSWDTLLLFRKQIKTSDVLKQQPALLDRLKFDIFLPARILCSPA